MDIKEATEKKGGVNEPPTMPPPEPPKGQGGIHEMGMVELSLEGLPIHSISVNGEGDVPLIIFPQNQPLIVYKGMSITIRF